MSRAGAIRRLSIIPRSRTRSPLSRSAGEGPGGRANPSPSPLAPFLSRAAGEEGGMVGLVYQLYNRRRVG